MVERSLSMREVLGSMPRFSNPFVFLSHYRFFLILLAMKVRRAVVEGEGFDRYTANHFHIHFDD